MDPLERITWLRSSESPLEPQSWLSLCLHGMQARAERTPMAPCGKDNGSAVKGAVAHLQERYQDSVDLEELSVLTGLSRFSLVHAFSSQIGMPPHAYQTHVRIERARPSWKWGSPPPWLRPMSGFSTRAT
jgi:methylphosphotriester-DNA--protein-cysteine methyltransferase